MVLTVMIHQTGGRGTKGINDVGIQGESGDYDGVQRDKQHGFAEGKNRSTHDKWGRPTAVRKGETRKGLKLLPALLDKGATSVERKSGCHTGSGEAQPRIKEPEKGIHSVRGGNQSRGLASKIGQVTGGVVRQNRELGTTQRGGGNRRNFTFIYMHILNNSESTGYE